MIRYRYLLLVFFSSILNINANAQDQEVAYSTKFLQFFSNESWGWSGQRKQKASLGVSIDRKSFEKYATGYSEETRNFKFSENDSNDDILFYFDIYLTDNYDFPILDSYFVEIKTKKGKINLTGNVVEFSKTKLNTYDSHHITKNESFTVSDSHFGSHTYNYSYSYDSPYETQTRVYTTGTNKDLIRCYIDRVDLKKLLYTYIKAINICYYNNKGKKVLIRGFKFNNSEVAEAMKRLVENIIPRSYTVFSEEDNYQSK